MAAVAAPVSAQTAAPQPTAAPSGSGGDYHGDYEVGVNLFDKVRNRGETTTYSPGWYVGASYRITHAISVMGEAAGDYNSDNGTTFYIYTFSGGVRFQSGSKAARISPFAQVLMGTGMDNGSVGQSPTKNHFPVVTPGGGVDLRAAKHLGARLKLDFPLYATFGDVHKGLRLSLGATIPVGTR
jgi:hypothetical protein